MRSLALIFFVFTGLISNSQCVQNENITEEDSSPVVDAQKQIEGRVNGITSRTGKAISFFPEESASGIGGSGRQQPAAAARRIRFGDDEDANNYVNTVSNNDIGGNGGGSEVEIGERRPVYAYKRPDDGSIYQTQQNPSNSNSGRDNYYARPYEYSYNDQGQYYNPQPNPSYYSQPQQGNYYRPTSPSAQPPLQRPQSSPQRPSARPPVSQSYHHIPYPQSQGYVQQSQPQYTSQYSTQYQSQYPQQYHQQQPYPYSGPPQGPYYNQQQQQQQQQQPQRPPQYDNYSPNYPYQQPGGEGESGVGGLLGGLGSLFSGNGLGGGGGIGGGGNPQSGIGQFGYAIENIVRFDDYQCVPKIVCQMVGNPQRQATLPGWLNAPSLTALISAVPSTSPMLVFGRAALLGLSGGENHCDSSYPRCPRNEDDVLNYLNNHRGGFFRFFNGGANYGDESDYGYDQQQYQQQQQQQQPLYQSQQQNQQQQYQQPQYQEQQQQAQVQQSPIQGLDLGTISSLAEAINSGGGINLSNLGSNLGLLGNLASLGSALGAVTGGGGAATTAVKPAPQKQTSSLGSNLSLLSNLGSQLGLGNTVSNLLTGIVGARFNGRKARKFSKRSTEFNEDTTLDEILLSLGEEQSTDDPDTDGPPSKKRNLNKEIGDDATKVENVEKASLQKRKKYHQDIEKKERIRAVEKLLGVQARIINKEEIQAEAEDRIVNGNLAINPENSLLLNPIIFPDNYEPVVHIQPPQQIAQAHGLAFPEREGFREEKNLPHHGFVFPSGFRGLNDDDRRGGKAFQFAQSSIIQPSSPQVPFNQLQFPENFQNADGIILDIPKPLPLEYYDRTKMIFPDRTGTGNLRFDSEKFNNDRLDLQPNRLRIGRILTSGNQNRPVSYQGSYNENHGGSATAFNRGDVLIFHSNNYHTNDQRERPQFDFGNRYPIGNNNPVNSNRYQQPLATNYNYNRYQGSSSSGSSSVGSNNNRDNGQKIYVTNEQGIVTYYINGRGEKIAV